MTLTAVSVGSSPEKFAQTDDSFCDQSTGSLGSDHLSETIRSKGPQKGLL